MQRDYAAELKKQIQYIKTSCREYDAGNLDEAIRIGTSLRIIFYKSKNSKPITEKLPIELLLSTAFVQDKNAIKGTLHALVYLQMSVGQPPKAEYVPNLSNTNKSRFISVAEWWEREPIYDFANTGMVSRKRLVLIAANKDGGAHVDSTLPNEYERIKSGEPWTAHAGSTGEKLNLDNGHLASLRQMGHEVINSPQILGLIS
jgi:hypothetical protein